MDSYSNRLQVPEGFKDFLPAEAYKKRYLEEKWIHLFKSWAYREIVSSSFEYYDTLTMNVGVDTLSLLKTVDRGGHILALRPDMTSPIARLVATRMKDQKLPQRLFYLANVFRYESEIQKGRHREFYQAGVEFIGPKGPKADGEIIALAVKALQTVGLKNFQIGLGHMEITKGLLRQLNGTDDNVRSMKIRQALSRKNYVQLANLLSFKKQSMEESIFKLITTQNNLDEVVGSLKKLITNPELEKPIKDLEELTNSLKAYGVTQRVFVDFSILRDFNYYTGIVFEGYSENLGYPICGGGRYDNLLGNFGYPNPATGFAIGVERVLEALSRETNLQEPEIDYLVCGNQEDEVIKEANLLRSKGYVVEVDLMNLSEKDAEEYAAKRGINNILRLL
ncbi:MAG: hypothetical protein APF76_12040 [Desulfitibacter sp. BRH_c19]|nr:MAG: hypothetical protein APF76_12040 [Desulfitibacter sp. BRH_c19]